MTAVRVIYGFHAVNARLRHDAAGVHEVFLDAARSDARARDLARLAAERGVKVLTADAARLDRLTGNARHQGVAAHVAPDNPVASIEEVLERATGPQLLLVLDGIQDPHNLGACLRVADAFGVNAVIAPRDRAVGITAAVSKVACGAAETVPYVMVTNLARTLRMIKECGIWIVGADQDAQTDIYHVRLDGSLAWVLGAEGAGMRRLTREHCDELVRIPMAGSAESLNVSVACGICLAESRRRQEFR